VRQFEGANILCNLSDDERKGVRKTMIKMILATDLKQHFRFLFFFFFI
jgi:hypothetical protein